MRMRPVPIKQKERLHVVGGACLGSGGLGPDQQGSNFGSTLSFFTDADAAKLRKAEVRRRALSFTSSYFPPSHNCRVFFFCFFFLPKR